MSNREIKFRLIISGSIVNNTFDFSLACFIINQERSHFVDFPLPVMEQHMGNFINKRKMSISFDWMCFVRPFNSLAWISCFGLLFLICIIKWTLHHNLCINEESQIYRSLSFLFWAMFTLCQAYYWYVLHTFFQISNNP